MILAIDILTAPSIWCALGLVLGILELLIPGFVLLGFGCGALVVGAMLWATGPDAFEGVAGIGYLCSAWAVVSYLVWVTLRRMFGVTRGQSVRIDHDVNESPYKGAKD